MPETDLHEAQKKLLVTDAELRANLYKTAEVLTKKRGWEDASGIEALYLIFAEKYGWTPSQVRHLTTDELHLFFQTL